VEPSSAPGSALPPEALAHYGAGLEAARLRTGAGRLELVRTLEILDRYLPPPPAVVLDVGGGPGAYACWLARRGYEVHLVDAVPLHVEEARRASREQPDHPLAGVALGDARQLDRADQSADAVLLFGPLYHLIERDERVRALGEARRVLRPEGLVLAAAISRFASLLDGLFRGLLRDPEFAQIVEQDLIDGQHRNPTGDPTYFTTAFFHHPEELRAEVLDAGLRPEAVLAVEGPGWLLKHLAGDLGSLPAEDQGSLPDEALLVALRRIEGEPSLLGISAHLLAVARRDA
jgi:ubiquinone/menaquinone biosynthesis C-methylase UbiE